MIIVLDLRDQLSLFQNEPMQFFKWLTCDDDNCVSFKGPMIPCIIRAIKITDSYDMMIIALVLRDR